VEPIFLLRGAGESIADRPRRTVRILADLDAVVVTESRYVPGEKGPDAHIHRRHTDAFFLLDGALVFEVGREREHVRAEAGAFVAVPANVVHTFWNDGPGEAWFLNVHAPGENFAEHLRAARDRRPDPGFDTDDPPPDGGPPAAEVVIRPPGEGATLPLGLARTTFKLEAADRGGTFSLSETVLPPGGLGPVPHRHERFADSFYVLEGTLTLRLDDRIAAAPPGTFALAPPGAVHTFSNVDHEPVRFLNLMAPGGFEAYLREVLERAGDGPPTPALLAEIASRHDFRAAD
jgi:mannose-6-phosphate isomerase-like protein (cupin superfamily)